MRKNPNDQIGVRYGIFEIKEVQPYKDNHHATLYRAECVECGHEKIAKLSDFNCRPTQVCKHFNQLTPQQQAEWYDKNIVQCLQCGADIPFDGVNAGEYKQRKFCDQHCAAKYNNTHRHVHRRAHRDVHRDVQTRKIAETNRCRYCGEIISKSRKYCSNKCMAKQMAREYIERWHAGEVDGSKGEAISQYVRNYLFDKYDNKCAICGWGEVNPTTKKIPLQVHHIDGDHKNNVESNLILLCPNCHSQTLSWRGRNINNGRKYIPDEIFIEKLKQSVNIHQALIELNLSPCGGNYIRAKRMLDKINDQF